MSRNIFVELWFLIVSLFKSSPKDKTKVEPLYMRNFPFSGYKYMQWCGYIIYNNPRLYSIPSLTDIIHETIHLRQAQDKGSWCLFYLSYLWNWIKKDPIFHFRTAYYLNKYEVEAYAKENDNKYLERRQKNAQNQFKFKMDYCSSFGSVFRSKVKQVFSSI